MFLTYIALVDKVDKKSAPYGVMFPDFPGCIAAGKSLNEALENAREALIFHMEGMLEDGETFPKPSGWEEIVKNSEYKTMMPCLIHLIPPQGQQIRVNVSLDVGLLAEIDQAVKRVGTNRSAFLSIAARQMLA